MAVDTRAGAAGAAGAGIFLITRDDPKDDRMIRAAEEQGLRGIRLPLLATEAGPDLARLAHWLEQPPAGSALAWTSRRAAEALASTALPGRRATLARLPLFAVGEESAAPIRDAGFAVEFIRESPSAKRLAARILERRNALALSRVAFLHGDRALPDLPDALGGAGIEVESFEVYRTRFESPDAGSLEEAIRSGAPITAVFTSPSAIEALERLLPEDSIGILRERARAVAFGDTTRQALAARGYREAEVPSCGPAEGDPAASVDSPASVDPTPPPGVESDPRTTP